MKAGRASGSRLQSVLCRLHERSHCLLTGNGTAAIYLAIRALGLSGTRIAISNSVCPNVPIAIHLAGATPAYHDIARSNLGLDVDDLIRGAPVGAVIGVHAYGLPCDVSALETYCTERCIPLIEDAAVAQGASVLGRPSGSFGDISIVSFGTGKVVSAGAGGAVFTDDESVHRALVQCDAFLPEDSTSAHHAVSDLGRDHTRLYNQVYLAGEYDRLPLLFKPNALAAGPSFLHRFPASLESAICARIDQLESLVADRRRKFRWLSDAFARDGDRGIQLVDYPPGSVPWRCNLLIPRQRDELLRSLLEDGFPISSWYPSADLFFEQRQRSFVRSPVADEISSTILNVWVDESVDASYLQSVSRRILEFLS